MFRIEDRAMFGFNWKTFEKSGESFSGGGGARHASRKRPRIGLALGSGAARGWSHIGVLQELEARGVPIDVIAGASIGAVVGGCHAAGRLSALEGFARSLTKRRVFGLMDLSFSGVGMLSGGKLRDELTRELEGRQIENLPIAFADVATFRQFGLTRRPAMLLGMATLRVFAKVTIDFPRREIRFLLKRGEPTPL